MDVDLILGKFSWASLANVMNVGGVGPQMEDGGNSMAWVSEALIRFLQVRTGKAPAFKLNR